MNYKTIFILIFISLLTLPIFAFAQEETKTVEVEGYGSIFNNDVAMAREQAIRDARRNAVEQVAGTFLQSETEVENFMLKRDQILTRTAGYIKSEQVLSEGKDGEDLYKVKLQAEVGTTSLKDDLMALGILMMRKGKPRVMIVIPEWILQAGQTLGDANNRPVSVPNPSCESAVTKKFLEKGFMLIDQMQVAAIRDQEVVKNALSGDAQGLVSSAKQFGAEVLVYGDAFSQRAENTSSILGDNMISCAATAQARALRCDTGEIIAMSSVPEGKEIPPAGLHISEAVAGKIALAKAGERLADKLIEQIIAKWQTDVNSTMSVTLFVTHINYIQKNELKTFLENQIRGIQSVQPRSFMAGNAEFTVDIAGDANSLADEIINKKDALSFNIKIVGLTQNRLDVDVTE